MEKEKKEKTKKWIIPVVVVAVLLCSVVGYFVYQKVVNKGNNYGGTNLSINISKETWISKNSTNPRNHKIDTISLQVSGAKFPIYSYRNLFASGNNYSCNYSVDYDGRVGMYVEEKNRSWCNGNAANDHRAVTIILSSDSSYNVRSVTIDKLIIVMADICKRNGIEKLVWSDNREERINHTNGANVTIRNDFMRSKTNENKLNMKNIVNRVNEKLGAN